MKLMLGAAAVMAAGSLAAQTTTFNKAADWKKYKLVSDGDGVLNVACVSSQAMLTAAKRIAANCMIFLPMWPLHFSKSPVYSSKELC